IGGHCANRLVDAVVIGGLRQRLVGVVCRTVRRLEDRVERQPTGRPSGHDVAELVAGASKAHPGALPLAGRNVAVVDDGRVLHIAEAAVDRDPELDVLGTPDVVVGHEDVGEAQRVETRVRRQALQPAGTPVGPITNERPKRSVRMLGSAVFVLPWRSRLGLNVCPLAGFAAAADGPSSVSGSTPRATTARTLSSRRLTLIL